MPRTRLLMLKDASASTLVSLRGIVVKEELSWRLGMALAAINLLVVALAVTSANPRVGRGGNLALALFIFVVYYNFINLGQSWIGAGKVQWVPYVLGLHGGMLCLSLMWLNIRHNNWSWRQLLGPRRRQEASA